MTEYIIDIETDSLTPTMIHCAVLKNIKTGEIIVATEAKYMPTIKKHDTFIGHNIVSYDAPALKKLWGYDIPLDQQIDTLILSKMYYKEVKGGHSLKAWGTRLGFPKMEFEGDFSTYSEHMLEYCIQDVEVTHKLSDRCRKWADEGIPQEAYALERSVRHIINQQQDGGFLLDTKLCNDLLFELRRRKAIISKDMVSKYPPLPKAIKEVVPKGRSGTTAVSIVGIYVDTDSTHKLMPVTFDSFTPKAEYTRVRFEPFNAGSRKQIGERLLRMGWKPSKVTPTGVPMVDETILEELVPKYPDAALISEYMMIGKRIAQVESWLKYADEDGYVHGQLDTLGTRTHRMSHSKPNVSQVPSGRKPYGKVCRSAWTVPNWDTTSLVGTDASGLELRMLAHYMNDADYIHEILHGDIHTYNMRMAGLTDRDQAKTFIYAFLYGAGTEKLGSIVGGGKKEGAKLKRTFLSNMPALKKLQDAVTKAAGRGYVKAIDGRYLRVDAPHTALNTLLQGSGSIVMKRALVLADNIIGSDSRWVANSHDEMQAECRTSIAATVGQTCINAIKDAGNYYSMRCPLDGAYKIGKTWEETH